MRHFFHGAEDAHFGGAGFAADDLADLFVGEALEAAENDEFALVIGQFAQGAVEEGEFLFFGDVVVAVAAPSPYPGWTTFCSSIIEVVGALTESKLITKVERISLVCRDLFAAPLDHPAMALLNAQISVGDRTSENNPVSLKIEFVEDEITHIVDITSKVDVAFADGRVQSGLLLTVDSVRFIPDNVPLATFRADLSETLRLLHEANKAVFFDCLTASTIERLEPSYANSSTFH